MENCFKVLWSVSFLKKNSFNDDPYDTGLKVNLHKTFKKTLRMSSERLVYAQFISYVHSTNFQYSRRQIFSLRFSK